MAPKIKNAHKEIIKLHRRIDLDALARAIDTAVEQMYHIKRMIPKIRAINNDEGSTMDKGAKED